MSGAIMPVSAVLRLSGSRASPTAWPRTCKPDRHFQRFQNL